MRNQLIINTLFVVYLIISASCSLSSDSNDRDVAVVSLSPDADITFENDFMDILGWEELKTDEAGTYIGNVKKIEMFAGDYFILDNKTQKCVLRYDASGFLLNKIGKIGGGPGEYPFIIDFTIDREKREVAILTLNSTVMIYSLDGNFIKKGQLKGEWTEISANKNGLMATSSYSSLLEGGKNYRLCQFDRELQPQKMWIEYSKPLQSPSPLFTNNMYTAGTYTYFTDNVNLNIYRYDSNNNELKKAVRLVLGNQMPEENYTDNMVFLMRQREFNWLKEVVIAPSYFIVGYIYNGTYAIAISDWQANRVLGGYFKRPFPLSYAVDDDLIVSVVSPELYISYWSQQSDVVKASFEVNEDTNMLIMKWKPRQNVYD